VPTGTEWLVWSTTLALSVTTWAAEGELGVTESVVVVVSGAGVRTNDSKTTVSASPWVSIVTNSVTA
jgi:hypothetical protein